MLCKNTLDIYRITLQAFHCPASGRFSGTASLLSDGNSSLIAFCAVVPVGVSCTGTNAPEHIRANTVSPLRWALVEGYWLLGQRIRDDENVKKFSKGSYEDCLQGLANNLDISTRTIYYAIQAYATS